MVLESLIPCHGSSKVGKYLETDSKWVVFYPDLFLYPKVSDPYDRHVNIVVLWSSTCGFNIGRDCLKPNGLRVPTLLVKILKLDTVKPHNLKACMKNDILTSNLDTFDRMVYVWRFMSSFFNNRPKSTSIKHKYLTGIRTVCKGHPYDMDHIKI